MVPVVGHVAVRDGAAFELGRPHLHPPIVLSEPGGEEEDLLCAVSRLIGASGP